MDKDILDKTEIVGFLYKIYRYRAIYMQRILYFYCYTFLGTSSFD